VERQKSKLRGISRRRKTTNSIRTRFKHTRLSRRYGAAISTVYLTSRFYTGGIP